MRLARRDNTVELVVFDADQPLTWRQAAAALQDDPEFRSLLTAAIADSLHAAVFWETCPCSAARRDEPFAFVVRDAPSLARVAPAPRPFADELAADELAADELAADPAPAVVFPNLGGDAWLVVPRAQRPGDAWPHLADFLRRGPQAQVDALWREVGAAVERWWSERAEPVWVSTSGLGVYWLHIRLDQRPKYYGYAPFRAW